MGFALEHDYRVEDYTFAFCNYHDGSSNIQFLENYHPYHFFEYPRSPFRIINRIKWKFRNRGLSKAKLIENFDPTFYLPSLEGTGSIELKGFHFSSEHLVIKHREKILEILEFRREIVAPIEDRIQKARKEFSVLLGVHIRHNDFKDFYEGKYFVPIRKVSRSHSSIQGTCTRFSTSCRGSLLRRPNCSISFPSKQP